MTINQLIKKLEKIQNQYGKRIHVSIDVTECAVNPSIYQDHSHWSVGDVTVENILWEKEGSCILENGTERTRNIVSISL